MKSEIISFGYSTPAYSNEPIFIRVTLKQFAEPEPIGYRLAFRLGQKKGVKFSGSKLQG